ncbi:RNA polymerase sigma-I factor [Paenibacillus sp. 481]|uniref:RNA polymerase sigma-I factor n=1 Tax=Paenibacillus sp. 481 TaxID=2835869 RepID=UPI001E5F1CD3|nr:RNA polymerase sigma-I factor [Paenibacillus sp. 481]UHA75050.1 RNA polymerase sigma-I factor [Paenibacillus sp. 481]
MDVTTKDADAMLLRIRAGDMDTREQWLRANQAFVLRTASHICRRPIHRSDDEASIALIAFNEAIDRYDSAAGKSFERYAALIIRNRLIDYFRKQGKVQDIPFSSGDDADDASGYLDDVPELSYAETAGALDVFARQNEELALAQEIMRYDEQLALYGISLEELADCCPQHHDTRQQCIEIAERTCAAHVMLESLLRTRQLPLKALLEHVKVSRKTLERHRKYIIALVLVMHSNEFTRIRNAIPVLQSGKEGASCTES